MVCDIAVIGAGVTGCLIARELSMYDVKVCVFEATEDVATGTSKANSGIVHAGYDATPGSMKAAMNVKGNAMMKTVVGELGVPYKNCGSFVVAFCEEEEASIRELEKRGKQNGVEVKIMSGERARALEPALSDEITLALWAPSAGIICPWTLTIAAAENAAANGSEFFFNSRVTDIQRKNGRFLINAGENTFEAKQIINAAGVYADEISSMAGGERFGIRARKGEYIVFDTEMEARTNAIIFGAPSEKGKGVLASPSVHGNMFAGPTSEFTDDKEDKSTSGGGLEKAVEGSQRLVPGIQKRYAIAVFSGLRAVPDGHDFIIERSKSAPGLVNVAGIESPGLTSAPAIAEYVTKLLFEDGLPAVKKDAVRIRKPIEAFAEANPERRQELIKKDANYANVVCRCKHVTEAEVIESIRRPCGATTVDGVKFRTGAGMGRCHGGFCMPRIMRILARELGREYSGIEKGAKGSYILTRRTKGDI